MPLLERLSLSSLFLFLLSISSLLAASDCRNSSVHVWLRDGVVAGRLLRTSSSNEASIFLGVPYASPPVGALRFQPPQPLPPWNGVLECKEYQRACWQLHTAMDGFNYTGTEDCLYLNVFSGRDCLREKSRGNCPVMYYVHGGGYDADTPASFSPELLVDNFASKGLVMVTVQYRLNAFGFWTLGDEEVAGNYGMYDMEASLQWIQSNIDRFGGDPKRVTIMGHSSGGAAVSLLSLSPQTEGLFHQVVMMSGFSATMSFNNDLDFYRRLAETLGCAEKRDDKASHARIVDCMRRLDEDTLGRAYLQLQSETNFRTSPRLDGPHGLFPSPLATLVDSRRPYPTVLGTTSREFRYHPLKSETVGPSSVNRKCRQVISGSWHTYRNPSTIAKHCRSFYTRGTNSTADSQAFWIERVESVESDQLYHAPCYLEAESILSRGAPVYLYSFEYAKRGREAETPFHSFDMTYLIGLHPFEFDERDRQIQSIYAALFANFAKYGDPTPEANRSSGEQWSPLKSPRGFNYYRVDLPSAVMDTPFHPEANTFWNYVVPALEDEDRMRLGFLGAIELDNSTESNSTITVVIVTNNDHSSTFWKVAFGLTLVALIIVLVLLGFFAVREASRRRRQLRVDAQETRPILILSMDDRSNNYQTF